MAGGKRANEAAEEPEDAAAQGPPAGGLDMPPPPPPLEAEAFPGEGQLAEDERHRWLVLHFSLPRTIMTCDMARGQCTEAELNDALSYMAWGSVESAEGEWTLESQDPSLEAPHPALISYAEYLERSYPLDGSMGEEACQENARMAAGKRVVFTGMGEPGAKFRPMMDQIVKNLAYSNKTLMKAFDIKKAILNEEDLPEDPSRPEAQAIVRYGRHQILPAFWQLLISLTKRGRRFSLVFRTFSEEQLAVLRRELHLFCQGQHPLYCGLNKTPKPPPMSGDKGSRDLRLADASVGRMDRTAGRLEFPNRPAAAAAAPASPDEADAAAPPPASEEGAEAAASQPEQRPSAYNFPPFHEAYAGLMHHVLDGADTAAIVDDLAYWEANGRATSAGKLLLVDHAGGLAETKVQHVFFDGNIQKGDGHCVDVRDVVSGEPIPFAEAEGTFMHRVDLFQACTDSEYFVKALEACEVKMSQKILESRRAASATAEEEARRAEGEAAPVPPKEYLYRNVIPALLPALEACQRDRPADPVEFIAFYMLRHSKGYSKTLTA